MGKPETIHVSPLLAFSVVAFSEPSLARCILDLGEVLELGPRVPEHLRVGQRVVGEHCTGAGAAF